MMISPCDCCCGRCSRHRPKLTKRLSWRAHPVTHARPGRRGRQAQGSIGESVHSWIGARASWWRQRGDAANHRQWLTLDRGRRADHVIDDAREGRAHVANLCAEGIVKLAEEAAFGNRIAIADGCAEHAGNWADRKSTRLNSSHSQITYAVVC